jgi:MFS family permease
MIPDLGRTPASSSSFWVGRYEASIIRFVAFSFFQLTPFPGLFPLSEAIAWSSVFPYIAAMIESFPSDQNGQNTSVYAGIMVSIFTFGEFIMAPQWARISDRIGRKPTLLVGSAGAILSAATFGLARSLPVAIASRAMAGLLNPNLGVLKTFIGESVQKEHQGRLLAFSALSFIDL